MGAPPVEVAEPAAELAAPERDAAREDAADSADDTLELAADRAEDALELAAEAFELAKLERAEEAAEAAEEASERADDRADEAPGVLKTVEKPVVTGLPEIVAMRGTVVMAEGVAPPPVVAAAPVVAAEALAAEEAADAALERMVRAEPPETLAEARRALQYASPKAITVAASAAPQASLEQSRTP